MSRLEVSGGHRARTRNVESLEVHFGKPVVARVRKCRLVVVKNRLQQEEDERAEDQAED